VLVRGEHVALLGRRDAAEPSYGHAALAASPILDLPDAALVARGYAGAVAESLARVGSKELDGFWIHVDADVLNPIEVPAVDSPEPGGPTIQELVGLLRPLVNHPRALGLELTIYDPGLDADGASAARLVTLLETLLTESATASTVESRAMHHSERVRTP
jgi:arginase